MFHGNERVAAEFSPPVIPHGAHFSIGYNAKKVEHLPSHRVPTSFQSRLLRWLPWRDYSRHERWLAGTDGNCSGESGGEAGAASWARGAQERGYRRCQG